MSAKMSSRDLFCVGSAFWLVGFGMTLAGLSPWSWVPISWGSYFLGCRYGRYLSPADNSRSA